MTTWQVLSATPSMVTAGVWTLVAASAAAYRSVGIIARHARTGWIAVACTRAKNPRMRRQEEMLDCWHSERSLGRIAKRRRQEPNGRALVGRGILVAQIEEPAFE